MTAEAKEWASIALHNAELLYQQEKRVPAGTVCLCMYCMYVSILCIVYLYV